jgi:hypothetical protein
MPANAGIQVDSPFTIKTAWIPACAGMTAARIDFQSTQKLCALCAFAARGIFAPCLPSEGAMKSRPYSVTFALFVLTNSSTSAAYFCFNAW